MLYRTLRVVVAILFFLVPQSLLSQNAFVRDQSVPITVGNAQLADPWFGGLNCPQFNTIDLDNDGKEDLVVFNKGSFDAGLYANGHKLLTFLNKGTSGQVNYEYAPEYEGRFPIIRQWMLLRDLNCDGVKDIISSNPGVMFYYKGSRDGNGDLSFEFVDTLKYNSPTGRRNIFVSAIDLPAVADVNGDGDLDVLTFSSVGFYMEYYENLSVENGGCSDSSIFDLITDCWGNIKETGITESVILDTCGSGKTELDPDPGVGGPRHPGSTIMAFDEDGDGDLELVVGDISFPSLNRFYNGGTGGVAHVTDQDPFFPSYDVSFDLEIFPAAFYEDINNDGKKDMIGAPSAPKRSENVNCSWLYLDKGTGSDVVFELETDSFLVRDAIDLGEGAYPCFFDYNADGKMDLLVGNFGYFDAPNFYISTLTLMENIGTATEPAFKIVDRNYLNASQLVVDGENIRNITPTVGDLDEDGDIDLMIGDATGQLHYFENTAGQGNTASFTLIGAEYAGIDVGNFSAPYLYDVNHDGILDMLIGRQRGEVHYFENRGTAQSPQFDDVADNTFFGGIDVGLSGFITGYSMPQVVELDNDGVEYLLVGNEIGNIELYRLDQNKLYAGSFDKVYWHYSGIDEGERTSIAVADIDDDGKYEMVTGNYRGGLGFYQQVDYIIGVEDMPTIAEKWTVTLFPNPATDQLTIAMEHRPNMGNVQVELIDILGKKVMSREMGTADQMNIDVSSVPNGMYLCRTIAGDQQLIQKVLIK